MHSIIINTYERPESLSRCLGALARQEGIDEAEVVVVDDGGRGDLKAVERAWKRKLRLRMLRIEHVGWSVARNRGMEAARGERALFLGDDIMVRPGWFRRHVQTGEGKPDRAVLGPYPLKMHEHYSAGMRDQADTVRWDDLPTDSDPGFQFFMTGNLSADRERLLELGGFDPAFVEYGWEDIDLGYRFFKSGGRLILDPAARAVHEHREISRRELWLREYQRGVGAARIWCKWPVPEMEFVKFWGDRPRPGSSAKRAAARAALAALERTGPAGGAGRKIYEYLVYSYRFRGAWDGLRRFAPKSERP